MLLENRKTNGVFLSQVSASRIETAAAIKEGELVAKITSRGRICLSSHLGVINYGVLMTTRMRFLRKMTAVNRTHRGFDFLAR